MLRNKSLVEPRSTRQCAELRTPDTPSAPPFNLLRNRFRRIWDTMEASNRSPFLKESAHVVERQQ